MPTESRWQGGHCCTGPYRSACEILLQNGKRTGPADFLKAPARAVDLHQMRLQFQPFHHLQVGMSAFVGIGLAGSRISKKQGALPVRLRYSTVCDTKLKLSAPTNAAPTPSMLLSNRMVGTSRQNASIWALSDARPSGAETRPAGERSVSKWRFRPFHHVGKQRRQNPASMQRRSITRAILEAGQQVGHDNAIFLVSRRFWFIA